MGRIFLHTLLICDPLTSVDYLADRFFRNRVLVGVLLKHFIGEPRPYFMAACQPDLMALQALVANGTYFFSPSICTGELADIGKA